MNETQRLSAIKTFIDNWSDRGSEKSDAHSFWIELLNILGLEQPTQKMQFEVPVDVDKHKCFIDIMIPSTKVLIENKSRGSDLDKPAKQSDGALLTPFQQAKRYALELPQSQFPRWIVTCNFNRMHVYDLGQLSLTDLFADDLHIAPSVIELQNLKYEYARLNFLVDPDDENVYPELKISKRAGELIGNFYRAVEKQSGMRNAELEIESNTLSMLCVRLVFCLYAEDAFIFERNQFTDYVRNSDNRRAALIELFNVLNTPKDRRDPNLRAELAAFPYVNGALFENADDIPDFNQDVAHHILVKFDEDGKGSWAGINPTIFGALFESTLNPETRRHGGMHYTSVANIHKVIDPLFLEALYEEFKSIKRRRKNKRRALEDFQFKLASLTFLDPACGSGNFLTETYLSLRELENNVLRELRNMGAVCTVKVSIDQFFGIEVNEFACAVARTALWISENQMLRETEMFLSDTGEPFLPLTRTAHIICGNALRLDWNDIVPRGVDYVIGNPPFVGFTYQTDAQKADLQSIFPKVKNLDYVCCWFKKAADFMKGGGTRAAFVSTNSINRGETVARLFPALDGIHIDFARRTFRWLSESEDIAAVHCVIVGFSHAQNDRPRIIYDGDEKIVAKNINAYLMDASDIIISSRNTSLCDVPSMVYGNKPADGGNLILSVDERDDLIRREPRAEKFIRRYVGAEEFINGKDRYCLWLVDATADDLQLPLIAQRVDAVRQFRLSSKKVATKKDAATPHLFQENHQPTTEYILVPRHSGDRRKYIPMGFMSSTIVCGDANFMIPNAGLYEFGVLMSVVHMAWTRVTCGRLGTSYRYSRDVVYNNFPWCGRVSSIEQTAQGILDARALYPDWTLAALYDEEKMPSELRAVHEANDRAVLDAYGFEESLSESEIVARLMSLYQALIKN